MKIKIEQINDVKIGVVEAENIIINSVKDGVDLLGDWYYQGFDKIIINQRHITSDFFDLKNGIAGEILQKFSNYRVRLAIVGDFSAYTKRSIKDFIYESNQGRLISFVASEAEALNML